MYEYHIYRRLKEYAKVCKAFHMPGHKGRGEFSEFFPAAELDVTELSWSDNLSDPDGVIASAQKDVAEILGAKKSYFLTDGSSSGIMAMIFAAAKRGKKLIVPRISHQSVWNACRLFGVEPIIVQGKIKDGIMLPPEPEAVEKLFKEDGGIAGMVAVSPDYYGNIAPLEEYSRIIKPRGGLLVTDGAHGAHLAFGERGKYAGTYSDIWVDGAHKTLCTLTQGAVLNVNCGLVPEVEEGLGIFRTTSPSYPIMASVEYGVKFLANHPSLVSDAEKAALGVRKDKFFTVYQSGDWAKLAIDCSPYGISADIVAAELEKSGIYCEFSDGRYVLFYLSPMVGKEDIGILSDRLKAVLTDKKFGGSYRKRTFEISAECGRSFLDALRSPSEWVELKDAVGRTCAANAGIAPPCIPICAAGEKITGRSVKALSQGKTFGLSNGRIKVVYEG